MNDQDHAAGDEARFVQLVAMFQLAAMQQMGKSANPVTDTVERDLQQARATIDILETLERKTEGNRTEAESAFLEKVLFELRMNFVDETHRAEGSDSKAQGIDGRAQGDAPAEAEPSEAAGGDEPNAG